MKKKKVTKEKPKVEVKPQVEIKPKVVIQSPKQEKSFETTDLNLVYKLNKMGFKVKTAISPCGERRVKLYVFEESENKIKEALNG